MLAAEKPCRHFRAGTVYYSPDVIQWKKKGYVWSLIAKKLEGKVINTAYICRLAHQVEISSPLLVFLEEDKKLGKECYDEFHRLKPNAPEYRRRFLSQQMDEMTAKGNLKK